MKITVYSDVHGNYTALEKLYLIEKDSDLFICLGDVVGYGPHTNECVEFIEGHKKTICTLGNHEEMYIKGKPSEGCSSLAKKFYDHTFPLFKKENFKLLLNYSDKIEKFNYTFKHTLDDSYIYANTLVKNLLGNHFIGHSHSQFIRDIGKFKLISTGSLGQNKKDKEVANYAILKNFKPSLRKFKYSVNAVIADMAKLKYPGELIRYYL